MNIFLTTDHFMSRADKALAVGERARLYAMLALENSLWQQGLSQIAGVDEAGRGPLAGPIVAAAVILCHPLAGLNDSKRLTAPRRESLFEQLMHGRHHIGVASLSAAEIDAMGIQKANYQVMRRAIEALQQTPDFVLVDGYSLSGILQPTMRVIKGDARSMSIAAASIVAKVCRDNMLLELDRRYPQYGFCRHKGYGTRFHLEAIQKFGPCPEHRKSFAPMNREQDSPQLI